MKIGAYVLAGDPAWVRESVQSYYDLVSHVVVAYDEDNRGWRGDELQVPEVLEKLRSIDRDGKIVELPGKFSDPSRYVLDLDTEQRQAGLDRASEGVDWVLQLDTDELMASPRRFVQALEAAEAVGAEGLEYPLRYFYQRTTKGRFLEVSRRNWRPRAGYPGPVAVRAGTKLRHCRQADVPLYRADLSHRNTDPAHPADARVDEVVAPADAIIHMWLVRTEEQMRQKLLVAGHADFYSKEERSLRRWTWSARHPFFATVATPLRADSRRLRIARSPIDLAAGDWYASSRDEPRTGT